MPKRIWITPPNPYELATTKNYANTQTLKVQTLLGGILLPPHFVGKNEPLKGGVVSAKGEYYAGLKRGESPQMDWKGIYGTYFPRQFIYKEESVIFGGVLLGHFGHFLLESLSRLWYVLDHPEDTRRIAFLHFAPWNQATAWMNDFFRLIGINEERIFIVNAPTQFKEVTLADETIVAWEYFHEKYTKIYDALIDRAKEQCAIPTYSKIYLTHAQWKNGASLANESAFEAFFKAQGFHILSPEKHSLAEQIVYLNHAQEVVTTMGSLAHLGIFCQPHTRFCVLTRQYDSCLIPQLIIHQARQLNWFIVHAAQNFLYSSLFHTTTNLHFTPDFLAFSLHILNKEVPLAIQNQTRAENYISAWIHFYSKQENFKAIAHLRAIDMLTTMAKEISGETINRDALAPSFMRSFYRRARTIARRIFSACLPRTLKTSIYQWAERSYYLSKILGIAFKKDK